MVISKLLIEFALFISFPIIAILIIYSKKNRGNLFLALSILNICYALFINMLNQTMLMLDYPFLMRTGNISVFLFFPLLYIYTRNTFYPGIYFRTKDLFFLIPVVIYIIDMMPFFLADPNYKIAVFREILSDPSIAFKVNEGWIGINGFHFIFKYSIGFIFLLLQINLICRNRDFNRTQYNPDNRILYVHLIVLTFIYGTMVFPGIFGALLMLKWYNLTFLGINLSLTILATAFFLLFSPRILYGFTPKSNVSTLNGQNVVLSNSDSNQKILAENKNESVQEREKDLIIVAKIEHYVTENKVFLDKKYSIHDLSYDIEIPVYQLSPIINTYFQSNFNNWINQFRVQFFIELCKNPLKKDLTLEALANEAGFSNRTTFINSFKKITGVTPTAYLKADNVL